MLLRLSKSLETATLFFAMGNLQTASSIYTTGEYTQKNPTYHVEDSAWKANHILVMLKKHNLQPKTICEVGCGAGEILNQLKQSLPDNVQFEGYEISPQGYALCQQRAGKRLRFHCESFPPAEPKPIDLLLCIDVFEHVPDYLGFLEQMRSSARHTIFHIPLDLSVQSVLRSKPIMSTREQFGHIHYYTKDIAIAALKDCGYEIIDCFYTPVGADRGKGIKSKLAKWPRKLAVKLNQDFAVHILGGHSLLVLTE